MHLEVHVPFQAVKIEVNVAGGVGRGWDELVSKSQEYFGRLGRYLTGSKVMEGKVCWCWEGKVIVGGVVGETDGISKARHFSVRHKAICLLNLPFYKGVSLSTLRHFLPLLLFDLEMEGFVCLLCSAGEVPCFASPAPRGVALPRWFP